MFGRITGMPSEVLSQGYDRILNSFLLLLAIQSVVRFLGCSVGDIFEIDGPSVL